MKPSGLPWITAGLDPATDEIVATLRRFKIHVVPGGLPVSPEAILADPEGSALLVRALVEERASASALRLQLRGAGTHVYSARRERDRLARQATKTKDRIGKARSRLTDGLASLYKSRWWKMANLFKKTATHPGLDRAALALETAADVAGGAVSPVRYPTADVVVCVHNALEDVRACLESVVAKTPKMALLVIVNDGSDAETTSYLTSFASGQAHAVKLITNPEATGYTRAANQGLRAAKSDYIVLLNSDTIVPYGWLERLIRCGESREKIGIVGPLSNAASWQSVPSLYDENGDWMVNDLPEEMPVDAVQQRLSMALPVPVYPSVPLVNGFCFAVKRAVIEQVGYLDEESFPKGYGEENDLCIRTTAAGLELAIADDAYVFHAKSKSYNHERRAILSKASAETLAKKHGGKTIAAACDVLAKEPALAAARDAFSRQVVGGSPFSILFLLGATDRGGGSHSVVQEAAGLRDLGCYAAVAVGVDALAGAREAYPEFPADLFYPYVDAGDLAVFAKAFGSLVATHYGSVDLLEALVESCPGVLPAYYIQDYEPLFFPAGSAERARAERSYLQVPGMVRFAKTQWICDQVGAEVHRVEPGLDTTLFNTKLRRENLAGPCRITAMIRPDTPRRAPRRTFEILLELTAIFGGEITVQLFGCPDDDPFWESMGAGFAHGRRGVLDRVEVSALLQESDVFLDLSDYQAFGRTGLEAMACGCVPLLPKAGGTSTFATDGTDSRIVDTSDRVAVVAACRELAGGDWKQLQEGALKSAARFSIAQAAGSELALLAGEHARRFPRET